MQWFGWTLVILCALFALYLWLIAPARRRVDASALKGWLYAHRGLYDEQTAPENSMEAFRRAAQAGFGIELDVQLTRDGRMVVHHDGDTGRVCGQSAVIRETDYDRLPLLPDGSRIPLFDDVLALVDGRAPLIVEVKQYGSPSRNAAAALEHLRAYAGPYCVESFQPIAVRYFKKHAPDVVRGQLATGDGAHRGAVPPGAFFALKNLLVDCIGRPDFIAYSVGADRGFTVRLVRRWFRPLLAGWTIQSQQELDRALKTYDFPIFERFLPKR